MSGSGGEERQRRTSRREGEIGETGKQEARRRGGREIVKEGALQQWGFRV